jgi:peptidoglycan/LPS O-acetylase OafA/YrhL
MDQPEKNTGSFYLPYIDGLRAIAVIAVIIYHLNSNLLPGGFTGVDIFFTISGFVVSLSVARTQDLKPLKFLISFYGRRILRIIPTLLVCLVLTTIFSTLLIPESWLSDQIEVTGKHAFFGVSNLLLMQSNNDYFGPKSEFNPFTHTWSLGIEEQFYLLFPILFYWWTISKKKSPIRYISILIFSFLAVISLGFAANNFASSKSLINFYSIFSRFWELASGVILYQLTAHHYDREEAIEGSKWSIGVSISLIVLVLGLVFARPDHFPFPWALFPVLGTVGLIFFLHDRKSNLIRSFLSSKIIIFIGKISYSLYLWHWPILVLFRWTVGLDSIEHCVEAVILTFILAVTSYWAIEIPLRQSQLPKGQIILIGIGSIALAFSLTTIIFSHQAQLSLSITAKKAWHPEQVDLNRFNESNHNCPMAVNFKHIDGTEIISFSRYNCQQEQQSNKLFVAGDSHTSSYIPMLQKFSMKTLVNIVVYTRVGCAYLDLSAPLKELSGECQSFYKSTTADILKRSQRGDIVFLPSLRLKRFVEQWKVYAPENVTEQMSGKVATIKRAEATKEAAILLQPFVDRGIKVVFEAPKPIFKAPNFRCSDWFNELHPICKSGLTIRKDILRTHRSPVMESLNTLLQQVPNVSVWDPFPVLCPGEFCEANQDHKPLFIDGDHISSYGNMLMYPNFKLFITELIHI